jgi:prolyl 4-hydroxylase
MKRAAVINDKTGTPEKALYRVSKSSFLDDSLDKSLQTISKRVTDMTRLSLQHAELLQVVNYGLGGQYEPHNDFFTHQTQKFAGNRIATVLFYVSSCSLK